MVSDPAGAAVYFNCDRFRQLLELRKVSQLKLGRELGLDHSYMSRLATGKRDPSLAVLVAIAGALRCKPGELVRMPGHD